MSTLDQRSEDHLISVVVPVYNEESVIEEFYARTTQALSSLDGFGYEIIFVDDGSIDRSYEMLLDLCQNDSHLRIVKLSRNFGHQIAITAGIDLALGDCVVVIDADLQDPPEFIADMTQEWIQGADVVYGVRIDRKGEQVVKLLTASVFYRLLRRIVNIEIPADTGDFRLMSSRVVREFRHLREKDRYVRGLVSWIGFNQKGLEYHRDERFAGKTKYPFRKMIKFALDGVTSFSTLPLKLSMWLGYGASFIAFFYLLSVFVQKALGMTIQGWATIMVAVLFIGGVQLICLGILGEYLGRIFNEIKPRPMYVVEEVVGEPQTAWKTNPTDSETVRTKGVGSE